MVYQTEPPGIKVYFYGNCFSNPIWLLVMLVKTLYLANSELWKTLDSNDQNQVADQRFSLKQCFCWGCSVSRAQKTWL